MRVCFLFHREFLQDGSTSMNEYPLKLASLGVDTTVIAARNSRADPSHEVINGVDVHRILTDTSTSVSLEPTRFAYRGLKKLHKLHRQEQFDILHMLAFPNLGLVCRPVPWLDAPSITVADVRGTAVRNAVFDAISRWGIRLQDYLVDQTIVIDQKVADNIFPDTSDVEILRLGADLEAFTPGNNPELRAVWDIDPEETVLGYTGSLHPPRELDRLIDAFEPIGTDKPDTHLVIVGGGADEQRLREYAARSAASGKITFTGRVSYRDMPAYVQAFDIGLGYVPDKPQYRDQPPSKTVEFLAANLPTIVTDTPGNREYVTDGNNGLVVADTVADYRRGMERLLDDPAFREHLGTDARESVAAFGYRAIVENDLLPVYERLIEE
jgi:glycosyltransferase involved in cell wall biosynthesis